MVDKRYCMSSYLAFRYIERDGVDFYEGLHHRNHTAGEAGRKKAVRTAREIGDAIAEELSVLRGGGKNRDPAVRRNGFCNLGFVPGRM